MHGKHPRNRTTLTKYSRHYFPYKRLLQNVWPSKIFLVPEIVIKTNKVLRALLSTRDTATKCVAIQNSQSHSNLEIFQSVRTGHPKVTKYQRDNFPHKRPPQNVWPSKNILSPRNLKIILSVRTGHPKVTKYQRDDFPQNRLPQNVWPSKNILSPRNLKIILIY